MLNTLFCNKCFAMLISKSIQPTYPFTWFFFSALPCLIYWLNFQCWCFRIKGSQERFTREIERSGNINSSTAEASLNFERCWSIIEWAKTLKNISWICCWLEIWGNMKVSFHRRNYILACNLPRQCLLWINYWLFCQNIWLNQKHRLW